MTNNSQDYLENGRVSAGEAGVWRKYPALRLLVYAAVTVTAGWLALAVFMPPGIARVAYVALLIVPYLSFFMTMAFWEESIWVNFAIGPIFFGSLLVIDWNFNPGDALAAGIPAAVHALVQGGLAAAIHWPERHKGHAAVDSTAGPDSGKL